MEEDTLHEIRDTENELTHVCINYLGNWERIPSLKSQLLEVVTPTDPARHYYQTCFAINTRGPANLRFWSGMKSQYGQYLYFVAGDLTVTFVFHLYSTSRWQYITLAWTEVPYYQDKFVLFFRNTIVPTHPTVLG